MKYITFLITWKEGEHLPKIFTDEYLSDSKEGAIIAFKRSKQAVCYEILNVVEA